MAFSAALRPRRPLLVPPGMLALTGLLWLAAATLPRWGHVFYPQPVMQLTVPRLPISDIIWPMPRQMRAFVPRPEPELRYSQLPHWRDWETVEFGHGKLTDSLEARRMIRIVSQVAAEQERGSYTGLALRVRFGPYARYASLVRTLDLMNQYNIKKYLLDIHHVPTTFYTLTGGIAPRHHRWEDPLGQSFSPQQAASVTASAQPERAIGWWTRLITPENGTLSFPADLTELATSSLWRVPLMLVVSAFTLSLFRYERRQELIWARMQALLAAVMARLEKVIL